MKYTEFIERVGWGEEFLFEYKGKQYWISQNFNGYYLTSINDGKSQDFEKIDELFNKALIERKTILQIWNEIKDQL